MLNPDEPREIVTIDRGVPRPNLIEDAQPFSDDVMRGFLDDLCNGNNNPGATYRAKRNLGQAAAQWARRRITKLEEDLADFHANGR